MTSRCPIAGMTDPLQPCTFKAGHAGACSFTIGDRSMAEAREKSRAAVWTGITRPSAKAITGEDRPSEATILRPLDVAGYRKVAPELAASHEALRAQVRSTDYDQDLIVSLRMVAKYARYVLDTHAHAHAHYDTQEWALLRGALANLETTQKRSAERG